jgi:hypothetical protein
MMRSAMASTSSSKTPAAIAASALPADELLFPAIESTSLA